MLLLIDNFDSFSHILADYFKQAGFELKIIRNDTPLGEITCQSYEGLVLSPGPETPSKAGRLLEILSFYHDKIPVLGVCLGHQAIGQFFGAKLVKGSRPVHGKVHTVHQVTDHPVLAGIPQRFEVTRYHSLEITELPQDLELVLATEEGNVMAVSHRNLPVFGIQFHPEAHLTQFGLELIRNWARIYCLPKQGNQRDR